MVKNCFSSTVVFTAKDGYNQTSGALVDIKQADVTTTTWGKYTGSDINQSSYIYNADSEIVGLVIEKTTTSDIVFNEAVITSVLRNTDGDITSITAYVDGVLKTLEVDKVNDNALAKGNVAVLKFSDGNSTLVKDIYTAARS